RFAMILGHAALRLMERLEVEDLFERGALRHVERLLHVSERDARPARELPREAHRFRLERILRDDLRDEPDPQGLGGVELVAEEVELARLRAAEKRGQEVRAAV